MAWVLQTPGTDDWSRGPDVRPYVRTGYWVDGYTVDEEWTGPVALASSWTLAATARPYVFTDYWVDGYTVDDEWSVTPRPVDDWVLQ